MGPVSRIRALSLLLLLAVVACSPATPPPDRGAPGANASDAPAPSARTTTLVTVIRAEPASLATRAQSRGVTTTTTRRLFNANPVLFDQRGQPQPYLAASLPQLDTDSWRVFPDGRMETTYRLKPNLTWHDGAPLTADDFVFASSVYASPDLGTANSPPNNLIDETVAPDPTTVLIRWKRPYADAGVLAEEFPPLPRHLLETPFQTSNAETFLVHPYWTSEHIGAGPFKLDRWEPGAFIEGSAFGGHALGAPKISRLRIIFIGDPNTVLANLLTGEVHFAADDSIRFQQGLLLEQQWARGGGAILLKPNLWRGAYPQLRPEYMGTPGLADKRVRKALAYSRDTQGLNDALFEGRGLMSDVPFIPNTVDYIAQIEAVAVKYPYDTNQALALLAQAEYTRGPDGIWTHPVAGRLAFPVMTTPGGTNENEVSILAAGWRQIGLEVTESILPLAQAQDGQARSTFPGIQTLSVPLGPEGLAALNTNGISRAENRWSGRNRGGWATPEFDRVSDAFTTTLDRQRRIQLIAEMVRIASEELPVIPLYFNPIPVAHTSVLRGPQTVAPDSEIAWNIHEWELR